MWSDRSDDESPIGPTSHEPPPWWLAALARFALVVAVVVTDPLAAARSAREVWAEYRRDGQ
jgi:hypothetical protein